MTHVKQLARTQGKQLSAVQAKTTKQSSPSCPPTTNKGVHASKPWPLRQKPGAHGLPDRSKPPTQTPPPALRTWPAAPSAHSPGGNRPATNRRHVLAVFPPVQSQPAEEAPQAGRSPTRSLGHVGQPFQQTPTDEDTDRNFPRVLVFEQREELPHHGACSPQVRRYPSAVGVPQPHGRRHPGTSQAISIWFASLHIGHPLIVCSVSNGLGACNI